jgi:hypothetical protein
VDQIEADAPHTFDLAYHQIGAWENLPAGAPWSSTAGAGYKYFTGATEVRDDHPDGSTWWFKTRIREDWEPLVALTRTTPTEVVTGYGIWKTTEDRVPMLIQRRHGQRTTYVWAVSLGGVGVALREMDAVDASGERLEKSAAVGVRVTSDGQNWDLLANPGRRQVSVTLPHGTRWQTGAAFAVH